MKQAEQEAARAREQREAEEWQQMRAWAREWAATRHPLPDWVKQKLLAIIQPRQP